MLRRIANHLFWAARNLERAEWRARLVNVNYHLLVESPPQNPQAWAALLAITGEREVFEERYTSADETSVLTFYTFDDENPSAIRSCIRAARESARAAASDLFGIVARAEHSVSRLAGLVARDP